MRIHLNCTSNLGDFVQSLPVLSGLYKSYGPIDFIIQPGMKKFNGIKDFLKAQKIFNSIEFADEVFAYNPIILSSWTREDKNDPYRPTETCRYENWLKDNYGLKFDVDDAFVLQFPMFEDVSRTNSEFDENKYLVGDRWNGPEIDDRRETSVLSNLNDRSKFMYLDYENDLLYNCGLINKSKKPFITNFTGIGMIADLMWKETYVVWKPEDWKPEFRNGNDISWDNGKNIKQIFEKHFYLNRKAKLIHSNDLQNYLN